MTVDEWLADEVAVLNLQWRSLCDWSTRKRIEHATHYYIAHPFPIVHPVPAEETFV
jgi:hypothetical protein